MESVERQTETSFSSFVVNSSSSRRLHLLAAVLSISPAQLVCYTNEVRRRGTHLQQQQQLREMSSVLGLFAADMYTQNTEEITQEFPPLLHAILFAVLLPFTNTEQASGSTKLCTKRSDGAEDLQRKKNFLSMSASTSSACATARGEFVLSKSVRVNMKEHFASLRGGIISNVQNSKNTETKTNNDNVSCGDDVNSDCTSGYSSSSNEEGTFFDSQSSLLNSTIGEEFTIVSEESLGQSVYKKTFYSKLMAFHKKLSATQDLAKFADNILMEKVRIVYGDKTTGGGNKNSKHEEPKKDKLQFMRLLPKELHTAAGVARISELYPPFLPLLLDALLKQCVNGDAISSAAKGVFVRLIELWAPVFVRKFIGRKSGAWAGLLENEEKVYHAMVLCATKRLVSTVVLVLEASDDPMWKLEVAVSLIASQLMQPSALESILRRGAKELANNQALWSPIVAFSYCLVTHQDLHAAVQEEEKLCTAKLGRKPLVVDESSGVFDGSALSRTPQSLSSSYFEEGSCGGCAVSDIVTLQSPSSNLRSGAEEQQRERQETEKEQEGAGDGGEIWQNGSVGVAGADGVSPMGQKNSVASSMQSSFLRLSSTLETGGGCRKSWPFPERSPKTVTIANTIIVTCMIICAGPLRKHTVLALGQWCLWSLGTVPNISSAVGLTHLMLKYPKIISKAFFRFSLDSFIFSSSTAASSSALNQTPTPFSNVVFLQGCRVANKIMQRQEKLRSDGQLTTLWQDCGVESVCDMACGGAGTGTGAKAQSTNKDGILDDLYEVQCYLVMMLQALEMRLGTPLPVPAQEELASLFVTTSRLRIMVGTLRQNEDAPTQEGSSFAVGSNGAGPTLVQLVVQLVDESFRAVARAVDIVLHDYDAGCPRQLCEYLVPLLPPKSTFFAELERVGVWEKHLDCLETVRAAAEAYREAIQLLSSDESTSVKEHQEGSQDSSLSSSSSYSALDPASNAHTMRTFSRCVSLLDLQDELTARVKLNLMAKHSSAEVMFGSLVGVLPSTGEPLRLAAPSGGGLTAAQRQWWAQHMSVSLMREWWLSCAALPIQLNFFAVNCENNDNKNNSGLPFVRMQRSFIQCCANPF